MATTRALTPLEQRFCPLYLETLNATEAYMRANPRARSRDAAGVSATRVLQRPHVQAHLRDLLKRSDALAALTIDQVIGELSLIATADPTWYEVDDAGRVTVAEGAPPQATRALAAVECTIVDGEQSRRVTKKVRLWDKVASLRTLAEYHGILTRRVDVTSRGQQLQSMTAEEITGAVVAALRDPGVRARVRQERPEILALVGA